MCWIIAFSASRALSRSPAQLVLAGARGSQQLGRGVHTAHAQAFAQAARASASHWPRAQLSSSGQFAEAVGHRAAQQRQLVEQVVAVRQVRPRLFAQPRNLGHQLGVRRPRGQASRRPRPAASASAAASGPLARQRAVSVLRSSCSTVLQPPASAVHSAQRSRGEVALRCSRHRHWARTAPPSAASSSGARPLGSTSPGGLVVVPRRSTAGPAAAASARIGAAAVEHALQALLLARAGPVAATAVQPARHALDQGGPCRRLATRAPRSARSSVRCRSS